MKGNTKSGEYLASYSMAIDAADEQSVQEMMDDLESSVAEGPSTQTHTLPCKTADSSIQLKSAYICYIEANLENMRQQLGSESKVS